jgi:amidase
MADVPVKFANAPIGLQLVGKHFRDEETVVAAELISKLVQS